MKRSQIKPLHLPEDIYAVLSQLQIGQPVPPEVYITDYKNGDIPAWIVREIESKTSSPMLILTVCDESIIYQETLFTPAHCTAVDVFALPTKTLRGPFYGYHPGCVHARNPLGDCRQWARQIVDRNTFPESEDEAA